MDNTIIGNTGNGETYGSPCCGKALGIGGLSAPPPEGDKSSSSSAMLLQLDTRLGLCERNSWLLNEGLGRVEIPVLTPVCDAGVP